VCFPKSTAEEAGKIVLGKGLDHEPELTYKHARAMLTMTCAAHRRTLTVLKEKNREIDDDEGACV